MLIHNLYVIMNEFNLCYSNVGTYVQTVDRYIELRIPT